MYIQYVFHFSCRLLQLMYIMPRVSNKLVFSSLSSRNLHDKNPPLCVKLNGSSDMLMKSIHIVLDFQMTSRLYFFRIFYNLEVQITSQAVI